MGRGGAHPPGPAGVIAPLDNVIWWPGIGEYVKPGHYDATMMQLVGRVLNEAGEHTGMTVVIDEEDFVALNTEEERFRSFAERYVIERAPTFRTGHEQQDAWAAMLDARSIYTGIKSVGAAHFGPQDTQAPPAGAGIAGGAYQGGSLPVTHADVVAALEAAKSPDTPKQGSLAKIKSAMRRRRAKDAGFLP